MALYRTNRDRVFAKFEAGKDEVLPNSVIVMEGGKAVTRDDTGERAILE
jgi:hypothetical protein